VSDFRVETSSGAAAQAEPFRIDEEHPAGGDVVVFVLHGEVDLHVAPEVRERLNLAADAGAERIVVDLARVTFLDSMALGVLLGVLKRLQALGGALTLVVAGPELRRIFEITLLDEVFPLAKTRQEALAPFMSSWGS
jgi:anti-sigma B factor antagonist